MARPKTKAKTEAKSLEQRLWEAADALRGNQEPSEYKHVVLGLVFLKYISDRFEERRKAIETALSDPDSEDYIPNEKRRAQFIEDRDEYTGHSVFWVPPDARWDYIQGRAKLRGIGSVPYGPNASDGHGWYPTTNRPVSEQYCGVRHVDTGTKRTVCGDGNVIGNRKDQMDARAVRMLCDRVHGPRIGKVRKPLAQGFDRSAVLGVHIHDQQATRTVPHFGVLLQPVRVALGVRQGPTAAPSASVLRLPVTRYDHAIPVQVKAEVLHCLHVAILPSRRRLLALSCGHYGPSGPDCDALNVGGLLTPGALAEGSEAQARGF